MATYQFGDVSADMRLESAGYGMAAYQAYNDFVGNFVPVNGQVLTSTATTQVSRVFDANNAAITVTVSGNLVGGTATSLIAEAAGVRETVNGSFALDTSRNPVSGTQTLYRVELSSGGLLFTVTGFSADLLGDTLDVNMLSGNDVVNGGNGNDFLMGYTGNDSVFGGAGSDSLYGGAGSDTLNGGDGLDTADYTAAAAGVVANLAANTVSNDGQGATDSLIGIEHLTGSEFGDSLSGDGNGNIITGLGGHDARLRGEAGADTILGGTGNDWIEGETGNDAFNGVAGNDNLNGEAGDDTILAGAGDDVLYGGAGTDFLIGEIGNDLAYGGSEWDAIDGRQGSDVLYGEGGDDIIFGDGYFYLFGFANDSLFGGEGNDIMMGEAGENSASGSGDAIYGEAGNDLLDGGGGNDAIYGGDGNDVIDGDHGNDYIVGGQGAEIMLGSNAVAFGGPTQGSDLFVYQAMSDAGDSIYGFDTRAGDNDGIDLRPLFDSLGYAGSNARADGYLYVFQNAGNADIYIDRDGAANGVNLSTRLLTLVDTAAASVTDSFFLFQ